VRVDRYPLYFFAQIRTLGGAVLLFAPAQRTLRSPSGAAVELAAQNAPIAISSAAHPICGR